MKRTLSTLLRIAVHAGGILPLLVLAWAYQTNQLTINPIQASEQRTGDLALYFLLLSLACTPLSTLTGFSQITQRRRALGLYAFLYTAIHLFIFTFLDYGLDWSSIWQMVIEKRYIFVGVMAFLALVPLAVTSFGGLMKRMGKNWKRLHRLVYVAGGLVILHFAWVVKGNVLRLNGAIDRPLLFGAIFLLLLILRLPPIRRAISRWRQNGKAAAPNRPQPSPARRLPIAYLTPRPPSLQGRGRKQR
jgi:methionine sulfoxide reductase heme-binding subunit